MKKNLPRIVFCKKCKNEKKKTAEHFMYLNNYSNIYNNVKLFSFIYTYLLYILIFYNEAR